MNVVTFLWLAIASPFLAWADALIQAHASVVVLCGGIWALWNYFSGNRIAASSLLMKLEEDYEKTVVGLGSGGEEKSVRELCEELESGAYDSYRSVLTTWANLPSATPRPNPSEEDRGKIHDIDRVMRFFMRCALTRWFGLGARTIDLLHRYYVVKLVNNHDGDREELRNYVKRYWPTVYRWGLVIDKPWPIRVITWCWICAGDLFHFIAGIIGPAVDLLIGRRR